MTLAILVRNRNNNILIEVFTVLTECTHTIV